MFSNNKHSNNSSIQHNMCINKAFLLNKIPNVSRSDAAYTLSRCYFFSDPAYTLSHCYFLVILPILCHAVTFLVIQPIRCHFFSDPAYTETVFSDPGQDHQKN